MRADWPSYDGIADVYASIAEPHYFTRPAEDLVSLLRLERGARLLDLGAGSGAVTGAAVRAAGAGTFVACDLAIAPLRAARRKGVSRAVVARIPRLPFRRASFDAVALAFVLSHLERPASTLREIAPVLAPRGRVAVSAWATSPGGTTIGDAWQSIAERYVDPAELHEAVDGALPSEGELSDLGGLRRVLVSAGFDDVETRARNYVIRINTRDYLQSRTISLTSRYLHARLSPPDWDRFLAETTATLTREFGEDAELTLSVNFAAGQVR
jgi:SAM-dependent methyltransferase